jgi:fatty acid/phospholipid biosynthesis enzyme
MVAASEVVTMDDPVEVALRKKKDSSMRVAMNQQSRKARRKPAFPPATPAR